MLLLVGRCGNVGKFQAMIKCAQLIVFGFVAAPNSGIFLLSVCTRWTCWRSAKWDALLQSLAWPFEGCAVCATRERTTLAKIVPLQLAAFCLQATPVCCGTRSLHMLPKFVPVVFAITLSTAQRLLAPTYLHY